MDPVLVIALVVLSFCFAAFIQSATGFGMALVLMALLPLVIPVNEAIAFVTIACFFATIFIMIANRSGLSFKHAGPLAIGVCIGIPIGYYGMRQIDSTLIIRVLGIALMAFAAFEFLQSRFRKWEIPESLGGLFGLIGGVLFGAFNVGGPPLVAYTYARKWPKVTTVATLQTVFIAGGITRNLLMANSGEYTKHLGTLVLFAVPAAIPAVWLGKKALDRLPAETLRTIVFSFIFFIGLFYVISG